MVFGQLSPPYLVPPGMRTATIAGSLSPTAEFSSMDPTPQPTPTLLASPLPGMEPCGLLFVLDENDFCDNQAGWDIS